MEKFEIDIKWGSYLFISNILVSISITLLIVLFDTRNLLYLNNILILLFIIQLFYFFKKAVSEKSKKAVTKKVYKLSVFTRVLGIYLFLFAVLEASRLISASSFSHPYIKENLSELLIIDDSNGDDTITLKDFIIKLKRKFSRS